MAHKGSIHTNENGTYNKIQCRNINGTVTVSGHILVQLLGQGTQRSVQLSLKL